jgi:hypothetical protein
MTTAQTDIQTEALQGISLCRKGHWKEGMDILGRIAEADRQGTELPGLFYSYLGYGIARYQRKLREGLALCHHAIKVQFYEPENYLNLARIHVLRSSRGKAVDAIHKALKLSPRHPEDLKLIKQIGYRRRPVIPFLSRKNPINVWLGKMRYQMAQHKDLQADPDSSSY